MECVKWHKNAALAEHCIHDGKKTFFFLFSNKMFIIRTEIHKILVRITNGEDPDQTVSLEAVCSESALFVWALRQATSFENLRTSNVRLW